MGALQHKYAPTSAKELEFASVKKSVTPAKHSPKLEIAVQPYSCQKCLTPLFHDSDILQH